MHHFIEQAKRYVAEDKLRKMINLDQIVHIPKGKFIVAKNKSFYLLSGSIRGFYLDMDGNDVTHLFIFENGILSLDFLTTDKPHLCSFEALEDCTALSLNTQYLKEHMKTDAKMLWIYVNILEKALKHKNIREISLISKTATERYLDLKQMYPNIENRVNLSHIASYLGINAASLSRIRRVIHEEN